MELRLFKKLSFTYSRWLFSLVYILSAVDIMLTYAGLKQGVIEEANPLVSYIFSRTPCFALLGMLIWVAVAMYLLYRLRDYVKWLFTALLFVLAAKLAVVLLHFRWIIVMTLK